MRHLQDQSRLVSRAARRTAERARRKRTKAWESPLTDVEGPVSQRADAGFGGKLPSSAPPVVDFLALGNFSDHDGDDDDDDDDDDDNDAAAVQDENAGHAMMLKQPGTPALKAAMGLDSAKSKTAKRTPTLRLNEKRRAQTPLSARSPFDSDANGTPDNRAQQAMYSSPEAESSILSMRSMLSPADDVQQTPIEDNNPGNDDAVDYECAGNKGDGECKVVQSKEAGEGQKRREKQPQRKSLSKNAENLSGSPSQARISRTYGNFYSPATFLRMRPYGAGYRVDKRTPGKKGTGKDRRSSSSSSVRLSRKKSAGRSKNRKGPLKKDKEGRNEDSGEEEGAVRGLASSNGEYYDTTSGAESEWMPGATTNGEETDNWEADGDSNEDDKGDNERSDDDDDGGGFVTDSSVKSGRWCRAVHGAFDLQGLTPKAPGVTESRPAHLRYVQSYAEAPLAGESELSEYVTTPHKQDDEEEERTEEETPIVASKKGRKQPMKKSKKKVTVSQRAAAASSSSSDTASSDENEDD